jgi:hypothetical protein
MSNSLNWRHTAASWALIVPIILASIATLTATVFPRYVPNWDAAQDGVVNPRHDPTATHAVGILEEDAH